MFNASQDVPTAPHNYRHLRGFVLHYYFTDADTGSASFTHLQSAIHLCCICQNMYN
jgi:hypothetical protein